PSSGRARARFTRVPPRSRRTFSASGCSGCPRKYAPIVLRRHKRPGPRRKGTTEMDFDFTQDQVMLRNLAREFLTEQCPVAHVRAMMDDPRGYDANIYRQLMQ